MLLTSWPWLLNYSWQWQENRSNEKHNLNNSNLNNNFKNIYIFFYDILSHTKSVANLNKLCGNESCKSIYKFKSKIFELSPNFVARDKVTWTFSKRIFDCVLPNGTTYFNCNSANLIYLITCNRCSSQHVGEIK